MRHTYSHRVLYRPESEGGFTAIVPSLPGCVTHGRTLVEAETMAADAIAGYLASVRKHGECVLN
ncbi:MAG: type II toxin-antitoxin system HicB family antitoxin [bacterium]|nr:type II toxin-antitoxin system HicB family antitoxin [bacterium]